MTILRILEKAHVSKCLDLGTQVPCGGPCLTTIHQECNYVGLIQVYLHALLPDSFFHQMYTRPTLSLVLWHCWLDVRNSIQPVKKLSDEVLAWLSVCNKVQMICIGSSWCHCHPHHRGHDEYRLSLRAMHDMNVRTKHFKIIVILCFISLCNVLCNLSWTVS